MSEAHEFATKEEFQRLTIRVEVLTQDVHQLTLSVADTAEGLDELRTEVAELRGEMRAGFDAMSKSIADGNAVLLSAILKLSPR